MIHFVYLIILASNVLSGVYSREAYRFIEDANIPIPPAKITYVRRLGELPEEFDRDKLPPAIQIDDRPGIRFPFLDIVDLITNVHPQNPFDIDTQFHIFSDLRKQVVPFSLFKNCLVNKISKCKVLPINLDKIMRVMNPNKKTVIIIGGFLTDAPSEWQLDIADKWMKIEDVNVVIVSWNRGNRFIYHKAVRNTKVVARQIAIFLYYFAQIFDIEPQSKDFASKITVIGHSLGGHIAGFLGQDFGGLIGRITGLDPAGPFFSENSDAMRLDSRDAQIVEAIHTNADFGLNIFLGIYRKVGHVDYYANDGKWQPNCTRLSHFLACNHSAAITYYSSILDHEIAMKSIYDKATRDKFRMFAYYSLTYEDFRSGAALYSKSRDLASDTYDIRPSDLIESSVPIDFVSSPEQRRDELSKVYGIDLDSAQDSDGKYYFFTSKEQPFVVDHNLIKLRYRIPLDEFDPEKSDCLVDFTYTMLNGDTQKVKLPDLKPNEIIGQDQETRASALPFVMPSKLSRYFLVNLDAADYFSNLNDKYLADTKLIQEVYKIFPTSIEIVTEKRTRNENLGQKVIRWFSGVEPMEGETREEVTERLIIKRSCPHLFKTVRVQPLVDTSRIMIAVYTSLATKPTNDSFEPGLFRPTIIRLKEGEEMPYIEIPEISQMNPYLYLDTIIIGPKQESKQKSYLNHSFASSTPYQEALNAGHIKPVLEHQVHKNSNVGLEPQFSVRDILF